VAYRAPLASRKRLLDFGVFEIHLPSGTGLGQVLAVASNEGGLRATCGDLRNPMTKR